jgi:magnesium-transporting ATPase (P-type)
MPVKYTKGEADPFLISGSKVLEGTGSMLVLAVGKKSQYGILKQALQAD